MKSKFKNFFKDFCHNSRTFQGLLSQFKDISRQAVKFKGFSIILYEPCVTLRAVNIGACAWSVNKTCRIEKMSLPQGTRILPTVPLLMKIKVSLQHKIWWKCQNKILQESSLTLSRNLWSHQLLSNTLIIDGTACHNNCSLSYVNKTMSYWHNPSFIFLEASQLQCTDLHTV